MDGARQVWDMLKAVDPTFTVNSERDFQARNAKAYEVELLVAPSRATTLGTRDQPKPMSLPEQEWLLLGRPVDQVVGCRDGSPARIVAPDPRWFALHKLWMAAQTKRSPQKRPKDRQQGMALLDAVAHPAALLAGDKHLACGGEQALVVIGDDQLHPAQTAIRQRAQEGFPEGFGFRWAGGDAQHFAPAKALHDRGAPSIWPCTFFANTGFVPPARFGVRAN